jgi:hypothetical protein
MGSISYTALREIEKLAYLKSGTDIFAAAVDDSFNATTTDLSGLLDDQWIEATGFADPANNGWFQAFGNSTATKINQDTSAALVDEGPGPSIVLQGHVRGLNQLYAIDIEFGKADRRADVRRRRNVAVGGAVETVLQRRDVLWSLTTDFIAEAGLAQWREFLASVEGGESFVVDPYGTAAAPDTPLVVSLESDSYQENRVAPRQYTIDFTVRVAG